MIPEAEFNDRMAADLRQLFRAIAANDAQAIDYEFDAFNHLLVCVLLQLLRDDLRWDPERRRRGNVYDARDWWIDFAMIDSSQMMRFCWIDLLGEVCWYRDGLHAEHEPVRFRVEITSDGGTFQSCQFDFGNLESFALPSSDNHDWAFSFRRGVVVPTSSSDKIEALHPPGLPFEENDIISYENDIGVRTRQLARAVGDHDLTAEKIARQYLEWYVQNRRKPAGYVQSAPPSQ